MLKILYGFSFSENYNGIENQTTRSTLNNVINPFTDVVLAETDTFKNASWLFQFKFKMDYLDRDAISSMNDYFNIFYKIDLMSQIYVLADTTKEKRLLEVYRKYFEMNLTISELCKFEGNNEEKLLSKNGNQIWPRRNNLTGVHFKVAYLHSIGYLHEENNVSKLKLIILAWFM